MTDELKFKDALENDKLILRFGSTITGKYIRDPYTRLKVNLENDRNSALNSKQHLENVNVHNFERLLKEFLKTVPESEQWKYKYYLEVPFPNPDIDLFNRLYAKFSKGNFIKRHWFRVDVYFPYLGIIIELDSYEYHGSLEEALDNTKENLILEHYGIRTLIRTNLASTEEWENRRRFKEVFRKLKRCPPLNYPIILREPIIESWNAENSEILPFFPYIESCDTNYFAKHDELYKERDVYLNYNSLPEVLKITIDNRDSVRVALENVYKRIKNINLVIVKP